MWIRIRIRNTGLMKDLIPVYQIDLPQTYLSDFEDPFLCDS
jgi:hypothetical protein